MTGSTEQCAARKSKQEVIQIKTFYTNAVVYPGKGMPPADSFLVESGRFTFVGKLKDAAGIVDSCDEVVDLHGAFVCAGFNDSHMHLLSFGQMLDSAGLAEHTDSLAGMLDYLRAYAEEKQPSPGEWIIGRGWNQDFFSDEHRLPSRCDLDKVSTTHPVLINRACGHCLVVNSEAIRLMGLTTETPCPDGGRIGIEDGEPDGRLYDNAMQLAWDHVPLPDKDKLKSMIRAACRALNACGITSVQTDDYCVWRNLPWEMVNDAFRALEESGELTVRVYEQANFTSPEDLTDFLAMGNSTGTGTDLFRIGPLKMLGDGSLGARTAFLSVPYADKPDTRGIPVFSQELLDGMIDLAVKNGMQVAVHTIGDACLDSVLSAYEKAFDECRKHGGHPEDLRCGIVHCQITRPDQLKKIADMRLHVYAQSIFLDYDIRIVRARVGNALADTSYSWKTLMDMGVRVSNGTDCPVEKPDAVNGIQCAVTRRTLDGTGPYLLDEAFTVSEAIDSYTSAGAYASFDETEKGMIAPGMLADFVVLERDPFKTSPDKLKDIRIAKTYLGGKRVYPE